MNLEKKKQDINADLKDELYFFMLKKVKQPDAARDIFQNVFLKAYENAGQLRDKHKLRAWLFQITRHEIADYFNRESKYATYQEREYHPDVKKSQEMIPSKRFCCFDKFISELPPVYRETTKLVYKDGKKQKEAAEIQGITLANVKARLRRAKAILKTNFKECCRYEIDESGRLKGEPDCSRCDSL